MKLLNEENDILLIQSTKAENELLRDVLKASLEFDYGMWGDLEESNIKMLIQSAENRIEQNEIVISRQEFLALYGLMNAAAHAVFISDYGLEEQPVKALMGTFKVMIKKLSDG